MKTVVHISADFPDPVVGQKTSAIANLVDRTEGFRHVVYSLNRVPGLSGIHSAVFSDDRTAVVYRAPPYGILLARRLHAVADWIGDDLRRRGITPDAVHAHKLTIEGLAGLQLSERFKVPLLTSLQGNTDLKLLKYKKGLTRRYARIWHRSAAILPFSVWARDHFTQRFGARGGVTEILPCITSQDRILSSAPAGPHFVTAFNLAHYRLKNAPAMIGAVVLASEKIPEITLDIYGGGSAKADRVLRELIVKSGANATGERIRLMGAIAHEKMQQTLTRYCAFILPSRRESYGMVFAEALLAGVPIMQPKGWGIYGLFDERDIGFTADPRSLESITEGLQYLAANEKTLKRRIARLQRSGALRRLQGDAIVEVYRNALDSILNLA